MLCRTINKVNETKALNGMRYILYRLAQVSDCDYRKIH